MRTTLALLTALLLTLLIAATACADGFDSTAITAAESAGTASVNVGSGTPLALTAQQTLSGLTDVTFDGLRETTCVLSYEGLASGTPAVVVHNCQGVTFKNVHFQRNSAGAIVELTGTSTGIKFEKCTFTGTSTGADTAVAIRNTAADLQVERGVFVNVGAWLELNGADATARVSNSRGASNPLAFRLLQGRAFMADNISLYTTFVGIEVSGASNWVVDAYNFRADGDESLEAGGGFTFLDAGLATGKVQLNHYGGSVRGGNIADPWRVRYIPGLDTTIDDRGSYSIDIPRLPSDLARTPGNDFALTGELPGQKVTADEEELTLLGHESTGHPYYTLVRAADTLHLPFDNAATDANTNYSTTVNGTAAYGTGVHGQAARFGTGWDSLQVAHSDLNLSSGDWSMAWWSNRQGAANTAEQFGSMIGKPGQTDTAGNWGFGYKHADPGYRLIRSSAVTLATADITVDSTWVHFALTCTSGGTRRVYVNGAQASTGSTSALHNSADIFIGRDNTNSRTINALVDDVVIAKGVLYDADDLGVLMDGPPASEDATVHLMGWVMPRKAPAFQQSALGNAGQFRLEFGSELADGQDALVITSSSVEIALPLPRFVRGEWAHVAILVTPAGAVSVQVDGFTRAAGSGYTLGTGTAAAWLAASPSATDAATLDGKLYDWRLYGQELTQEELVAVRRGEELTPTPLFVWPHNVDTDTHVIESDVPHLFPE